MLISAVNAQGCRTF